MSDLREKVVNTLYDFILRVKAKEEPLWAVLSEVEEAIDLFREEVCPDD